MTTRTLLTRRLPAFCVGLAVSMAALGGPSALSPASGSVTASRSAATTLNFPVTRGVGGSTDNAYDIYLGYRTVDGTAIAGTDYTGISAGQFLLAANTLNPTAAVNIPVTVAAATGEAGTRTLQLMIDSATGVGPAISFPNTSANTRFSTGPDSGPSFAASGDLNGDGKPDLAVATFTTKKVSVLLNTAATGASTPTYAAAVDFDAGESARSVAMGDVNGDGKPDLAVAIINSKVSVLLNTTATDAATPSFAPAVSFDAGVSPTSVAMGDINGDGKPDLVVTNGRAAVTPSDIISGNVSLLLNTTLPGASTPSYHAAITFNANSGPASVAIGDVNGDGRADLAVANNSSNNVSVLLNTGAAPYFSNATAANNFAVGSNPGSVAMGDINGDGKPDLAVTNSGNSVTASTTVSVLLNTASAGAMAPSFSGAVSFTVGTSPRSVAMSDLNGDGKPDLAVANAGTTSAPGTTVAVLLNTTSPGASTPRYATAVTSTVGTSPRAVAVSDVNGDGKPDLAVVNQNSHEVSVLINSTPSSPAVLSFASPERFDTGTGGVPQSVALGDLNGDGKPDLVVANTNNDQLAVLFNTTPAGDTTPVYQAADIVFSTGDNPLGVVLGDLNNDGRLDVVVANRDSGTVTAYFNDIAPGSRAEVLAPSSLGSKDFQVGLEPTAVAVGDLDGDGRLDLVVANEGTSALSILRSVTAPGDTQPEFAPALTIILPTGPARSIAIGDINGDGLADLLGGFLGLNQMFVLLKTTPASDPLDANSYASSTLSVGRSLSRLVLNDFNGDGRLDVAGLDGTNADNKITVLLNDATPAPAPEHATSFVAGDFPAGSRPGSLAAADFNGDGKLDLAVTNTLASAITVLQNNTPSGAVTPSFAGSASGPFATAGANSEGLAIGDVDGDGRPDLVSANAGSDNVSVLLNTQYRTAFLPSTVTGTITIPSAASEEPPSEEPPMNEPQARATPPAYRGGATSLGLLLVLLPMIALRRARPAGRALAAAVLLANAGAVWATESWQGALMASTVHRDRGLAAETGAGLQAVLGIPLAPMMGLEASAHFSDNALRGPGSVTTYGAGIDLRIPLMESLPGSFVLAGVGVQRDDLGDLGAGLEDSPFLDAGLGWLAPQGAALRLRCELRAYLIRYDDFPGADTSVDARLNLGVQFGR